MTKQMMCDINWDSIKEALKELIEWYSYMHKLPITADNWEELVWASLSYTYGEGHVDWKPRSHRQTDIILKINDCELKIGLKAGEIEKDQDEDVLVLSSYRLTGSEKLHDKLEDAYNRNIMNNDLYLICARKEKIENKEKIIDYIVYSVYSKNLFPDEMKNENNWEKTKEGWLFKIPKELKECFKEVKIVHKMSDQLWYRIRTNCPYLNQLLEISIKEKDQGKGLLEHLRSKLK